MANITQRITNCLWFDSEAEEAAIHYTSIFKNSRIGAKTHFGKEGFEFHKKPEGSVMTVSFFLDGQEFLGLNGGPLFKFNEAMSLIVNCETQEEIDHYWYKLSEGGNEGACGWLTDKFGLSWQIVPVNWIEMMKTVDKTRSGKLMEAVFQMKKFDLDILERIYIGK
jgi:predicted 3-demethylubiquinone-9 3-methyltransferase (glyoxalase superfamily)